MLQDLGSWPANKKYRILPCGAAAIWSNTTGRGGRREIQSPYPSQSFALPTVFAAARHFVHWKLLIYNQAGLPCFLNLLSPGQIQRHHFTVLRLLHLAGRLTHLVSTWFNVWTTGANGSICTEAKLITLSIVRTLSFPLPWEQYTLLWKTSLSAFLVNLSTLLVLSICTRSLSSLPLHHGLLAVGSTSMCAHVHKVSKLLSTLQNWACVFLLCTTLH